jgi:hypothetical protein
MRALRSRLSDQDSGAVVAIASACRALTLLGQTKLNSNIKQLLAERKEREEIDATRRFSGRFANRSPAIARRRCDPGKKHQLLV